MPLVESYGTSAHYAQQGLLYGNVNNVRRCCSVLVGGAGPKFLLRRHALDLRPLEGCDLHSERNPLPRRMIL
jgi:hypothetical protein